MGIFHIYAKAVDTFLFLKSPLGARAACLRINHAQASRPRSVYHLDSVLRYTHFY